MTPANTILRRVPSRRVCTSVLFGLLWIATVCIPMLTLLTEYDTLTQPPTWAILQTSDTSGWIVIRVGNLAFTRDFAVPTMTSNPISQSLVAGLTPNAVTRAMDDVVWFMDDPSMAFDERHHYMRVQCGWPLPCLVGTAVLRGDGVYPLARNYSIVQSKGSFHIERAFQFPFIVPYRPQVAMILLNGCLCALVSWLCVASLSYAARWMPWSMQSNIAGGCPSCGYYLGEARPRGCPECGWNRSDRRVSE